MKKRIIGVLFIKKLPEKGINRKSRKNELIGLNDGFYAERTHLGGSIINGLRAYIISQ